MEPVEKSRPRLRKSLRVRKNGRVVRQTTVYLPPALAMQLAIHCAENDIDKSRVIAAALERHFASAA